MGLKGVIMYESIFKEVDILNLGLVKESIGDEIDWEWLGFVFMSEVLNDKYESGWEEGEKFLEGMRKRCE